MRQLSLHRTALSACAILVFCVGPVFAGPENGEKVYQRTVHGTVWILVQRPEGLASGTGSLIDKTHRLVITNYHVVGDSPKVFVFFPAFDSTGKPISDKAHYQQLMRTGRAIAARVLERDERRDLALLQLESVPASAHAIYLAREGAGPGQTVHCIGNAGRSGALWGYTSGTVRNSAYFKRWQVRLGSAVRVFETRVVETQLPTNPGDSGGPLVNDHSELVAVTQGFAPDAQLMSLFIDVGEVKHFLREKQFLAKLPQPPPHTTPDETAYQTTSDKTDARVDVNKFREGKAARNLEFAKTLAEDGKVDIARKRYQRVVSEFPDTKAAAEAKQLLEKLDK
jgi:S1-C subfamily serine protease